MFSSQQGLDEFVSKLPDHLKVALTLSMHYNMFQREPLFKELKSKNKFLAWFGMHLKVWFVHEGNFLYEQGDDII